MKRQDIEKSSVNEIETDGKKKKKKKKDLFGLNGSEDSGC